MMSPPSVFTARATCRGLWSARAVALALLLAAATSPGDAGKWNTRNGPCSVYGLCPPMGLDYTFSAGNSTVYVRLSEALDEHFCPDARPGQMVVRRPKEGEGGECKVLGYLATIDYDTDRITKNWQGVDLVLRYAGDQCTQTENYSVAFEYECDPSAEEEGREPTMTQASECSYRVHYPASKMCFTTRGYVWMSFMALLFVGLPCLCLVISLGLYCFSNCVGHKGSYNYRRMNGAAYDNFPEEPT